MVSMAGLNYRKLKRVGRFQKSTFNGFQSGYATQGALFVLGLLTVLCLIGGGLINHVAGVDITHRLTVGTSANISKGKNLAMVLQRRIDDFGPTDIRVRVRERISGTALGILELHESGDPFMIPGHDLQIAFERFDDVGREFFVRLQGAGKSELQSFAIASQSWQEVVFADYVLALETYRLPSDDLHVRAKLELLDAGNVTQAVWLEQGREMRWRGYSFQLLGWEAAADGVSQILIHVSSKPGSFLFWLSPVPLLAAGVVLLRRRKGPIPSAREGETRMKLVEQPRRLFFMGVLFALLLLEGGAWVIEWTRDRLVRDESIYFDTRNPVPAFEPAVENGIKVYRRTSHHRLLPGGQSFLQEKPADGYRVFLLGGSAASGWPYEIGDFNLPRLIEKKLKKVFPDRKIEVINAAGGTYGSHRVRLLFDELIEYQPNLIVLYSGNNEFLENFVFRRSLPSEPWKFSALVRLCYNLYGQFNQFKPEYHVDSYTLADQTSNRIAYAFGKASPYRSDSSLFEQIKAHYRENITHIVGTAKNRGIASVILTVPVNLKDWIPNSSQHTPGLTRADSDRWRENFRRGYELLEEKNYTGAIKALSLAAAIDDEHAETHYYLGVAQHRLGEFVAAKASFVKALERDAYPFRALPQFQEILQIVSREQEVPLVDVVGALEALTADGIIGLDVLLDYVHLKESSQEVIAQQIMEILNKRGILPQPLAVSVDALRMAIPTNFRPGVEAQAIESIYGQNLIMRQYDKLEQLYQTYVETMTRAMATEPSLAPYCERSLATITAIHPIVMAYRDVLRAENLGVLEQKFSREEAETIYMRYVDLIQALEAPEMTRQAFLLQVPNLNYDGLKK